MLGYATINTEKLNKWLDSERKKANKKLQTNDPNAEWSSANWINYFHKHQNDFKDCVHLIETDSWGSLRDNSEEFFRLLDSLKAENQRLQVFYADSFAVVIGFSNHKYILPTQLVKIEYLKNYDNLTLNEIVSLGDKGLPKAMLSADISNETKNSIQKDLEDQKAKIDKVEAEYKTKIEEIREEARKKERELRELLQKETDKLNAVKEELENKILVLDTQIYGIRCYLGEVINFSLIRDGKAADVNEPVVVYQKFRYLDEELGKYFSLYDTYETTETKNTFMDILRYRDDIRDIFCPSKRTVCVLRISRTGTVKGSSDRVNNSLRDYEYLHAKQIAILVRDGEKLYIGWTDEDRVKLSSEDMFLKPGQVSVEQVSDEKQSSFYDKEYTAKQEKSLEKQERSERISRYYLVSILQGMIDNENMIKLPKKVKIGEESEYIKFSYAEGWLKDNRFGTFEDILNKSKDVPVMKGDTILTGLHISRDDRGSYSGNVCNEYDAYSNDRGIGIKNRTHGVSIPGFKIMNINKILKKARVRVTVNLYPVKEIKIPNRIFTSDKADVYRLTRASEDIVGTLTEEINLTEDDFAAINTKNPSIYSVAVKKFEKYCIVYDPDDFDGHFRSKENGYRYYDLPDMEKTRIAEVKDVELVDDNVPTIAYVSVPTESSEYNGTKARCNFQIEEDEYIRLNYLCSTWLKYVITTGNIGNFRIAGSKMSYADSLKYLNKLLAEVTAREEKEKELLIEAGLEEWFNSTPEWDKVLCEWRIVNNIQTLGIRAAKKFAKETR